MKIRKLDEIDAVFGSRPRDGHGYERYWWSHRVADAAFFEHLYTAGKSVCIDGPTGSGKTSLALRGLKELGLKAAIVTVSPDLTWKGLCREIVTIPQQLDSSKGIDLAFGLKNGLPSGNVAVSLKDERSTLAQFDYADKYLSDFSQRDLAKVMQQTETALFLDDFENASTDLVGRIASLIKILSTTGDARAGKVILTAADGSFARLLAANPTIDRRLVCFTLGGLIQRWEPWNFIAEGLDGLGIRHPGNSKIPAEQEKRAACVEAIYEASGGVLKNLTALGHDLASDALHRKSATGADIARLCGTVAKANVHNYSRRYTEALRCVREDPVVRDVLRHLHRRGISGAHPVYEIVSAVEAISSGDLVLCAIDRLVNENLLVQTGLNGSMVFPRDATLMHCFCLACTKPEEFHSPKEFFLKEGQLLLSLQYSRKNELPLNDGCRANGERRM